ncbi:hypothetical protein TNCV_3735941 [Trichonephila clavipes]|nr:hypothetical protein TNCV_3735941 [Trichonephila clavipes]
MGSQTQFKALSHRHIWSNRLEQFFTQLRDLESRGTIEVTCRYENVPLLSGVGAGTTGHCAPECAVHARWGTSTFSFAVQSISMLHIPRRTCCMASNLPGPQPFEFLLLGSPEIAYE